MNKHNAYTLGEYGGLYYVDHSNFPGEYEDFEGNLYTDEDMAYEELLMSLEDFAYDMQESFESFELVSEYDNDVGHVLLENDLFRIAYEDDKWSTAVKLIQKEPESKEIEELQGKTYQDYLNGMRDALLLQFEELETLHGGRVDREMCNITRRFHI